ncbi:hypothetical protein [Clostridium botulinum]|nr:hypothetical protein [Clostridium botulinum]MBY6809092.1 hypothetical protein [Clostridium botulinum]HBJ1654610.1 hypothetical protein [Clostridium botulinum]
MKYIEKSNTMNEFRYLNLEDQNSCYDYYKTYAKKLIERLKPENNLYNSKSEKMFNFDYKWDDCVNAGSIELKELDMIRINEGTILKLYNLFYKLNTHANIIELAYEPKSCTEIRSRIIYTNHKESDKKIEAEMAFSDDVIRNNIAEYMAMFAIKWVIAHEIGHAFNGHTNYYQEIRKKIQNTNNDKDKEELFLELQTMEMDADTFAINRVVDEVMNLYKNNDKILLFLKNQKDLLRLVILSIHGVFFLFRDNDNYEDAKVEHPSTFVRECFTLDSMKESLSKNYCFNISHDYLMQDIAEIEKTMNILFPKNNELYLSYIKNKTCEIKECVERIQNNFKNSTKYKIKNEARLPVEGIDY